MTDHFREHPTLSGAEKGKVRIFREIPGGIYFVNSITGEISNRPAWLRATSERVSTVCVDYARQMCEARGDTKYTQISRWAGFFELHFALIDPPREGASPSAIAPAVDVDEKGKLNVAAVYQSIIGDLAAGQLSMLLSELSILRETQTPAHLTHAQWEAIVSEGKEQSLRMLHSRHGSSALIRVLHGLEGHQWPESEPTSNGDSTRS